MVIKDPKARNAYKKRWGLGLFEDSLFWLEKARDYLMEHQ